MTKRILRALACIGALFGGTSASYADTSCNNTESTPLTGVINDNVIVPSKGSCTLGSAYTGAYVKGNIVVLPGATLSIQARQYPATISGNVIANQCASARLEGAVTIGGNVQIAGCQSESGFNGPGAKIDGNFECHNNSAPCDATLGQVGGNVMVHNNGSASGAPSNVSLTEIGGKLDCLQNKPAPAASWGGNWVSGQMQNQCAESLGFSWSSQPPSCAQLTAWLTKIPYIATATQSPPPTSAIVAGTSMNASYCNVRFTYSAIGSPAFQGTPAGLAPLQSIAYGYGGTSPAVTASSSPTSNENQAIKIGVGLPLSKADMASCSSNCGTPGVQGAWNGRLENLGGGGLVGNVGSTTGATNAGYVGTSTDTGHTTAQNGTGQGGGNFGVTGNYSPVNANVPTTPDDIGHAPFGTSGTLDVGKINDYIIEGIHQQVEWGKLISRVYYGQKWAYNYWNGCSTGGRQGLELAMYYGDEFDGFITGAPAFFHDRFRRTDSWSYVVNKNLTDGGYPTLTNSLWNATTTMIVKACQASNSTGAIGYLDDTRACTASASLNICGQPGTTPGTCLTSQQAAATDSIWNGPHNFFGYRNWYGPNKGVSAPPFTAPAADLGQVMSWDWASTTIPATSLYDDFDKFASPPANSITYENEAAQGAKSPGPPWSFNNVPLPVAADDLVDSITPFYGVDGVNLDLVRNRGGKIMMWQGTFDPLIHWYDSANYYRLVAVNYGNGTADFGGLQSWFRYYRAPGAFHCSAGLGPAPANIFQQLVDWVESNTPPDMVSTSGGTLSTCTGVGVPNASCLGAQPSEALNGTPFTPPLCPWPKSAVYNGGGPGNVASSYGCSGNVDANSQALCQLLRTPYRAETSSALNYAELGITAGQCLAPQ
jgi:hypothetical protein